MKKGIQPGVQQGHDDDTESKGAGFSRLSSFASSDDDLPTKDYETKKGPHSSCSITAEDEYAPRREKWGPFSVPTGWRFAVYGCILSCVVSFGINLVLTIIVVAKYGVDGSGRLTLYYGDCATTKNLNTGIHVFINALSTIILSSSNYVQQVLCAVTREEVDAAHEGRRRSKWADIGVPSMFNICLLDRRRVLLWYLLIFSSLPLHLL